MTTKAGMTWGERHADNWRQVDELVAEAIAAERERIAAEVRGLDGSPFYRWEDADWMCPNCVTPWKCNGPHLERERTPSGYEVDRAAVLAIIRGEAATSCPAHGSFCPVAKR